MVTWSCIVRTLFTPSSVRFCQFTSCFNFEDHQRTVPIIEILFCCSLSFVLRMPKHRLQQTTYSETDTDKRRLPPKGQGTRDNSAHSDWNRAHFSHQSSNQTKQRNFNSSSNEETSKAAFGLSHPCCSENDSRTPLTAAA
eukprot:TRINITY_DN93995_c0_g1_i1.p2 TRINITY_DN93995_c0_g1~~TRINITY_DN93995_c0_g1_i1.p2  ORF type:complete len:140 (+),score=0.87 TRINITY_DN93995_c0_g1_i1:52-471(+)